MIHKILPKQMDLNKILNFIQRSTLKRTHLPKSIKQIQSSYLTSLYFKDVYKYLAQNRLLNTKVAIHQEENVAERYMFLDSLLLKILLEPENEKAVLYIYIYISWTLRSNS